MHQIVRCGLVLISAFVAVVVGRAPAEGQASADTMAVVERMLEYWLAPENGSHYLGDPPYDAYHPQGEVRSFCVITAEGVGGPGQPLRSSEFLNVVRDRISAAFGGLQYVEECTRRSDDEEGIPGFFDGEGVPAVQVRVAVSFRSPAAGQAHFGLNPGSGLGHKGWDCSFEKDEENGWRLVVDECSYYES